MRDLKGVRYHQMTLEGHSQEALAWGVQTLHHSDLLEVLVEQSLEVQELHLGVQMTEEPQAAGVLGEEVPAFHLAQEELDPFVDLT